MLTSVVSDSDGDRAEIRRVLRGRTVFRFLVFPKIIRNEATERVYDRCFDEASYKVYARNA